MKKLLVLLFALGFVFLTGQAFGQAYSSTVLQNSAGNYGRPVPYPQVLVCSPGDTNIPCISRAATYTDDTLSTQCTQTGSSGLLIGNPTSGTNCNNPGIGDVNGNFTIYVASGEYMICTYSGTWLCQKQTIGGGSGGAGINSCTGNNCDAYFPVANVRSVFGDPLATDDGAGNKTGKSFTTTQAGVAGFHYFTQGSAPLLSLNNSIYFYAPVSVSTYAWVLPGSAGSGCMQASNASGLVTISFTGVNCGTGSGTTLQTNGTNNSSQTLLNFTNSPTVTASNPSGGVEQFSIIGAGQLSNPTAPTVTATGSTGSTHYCYLIVGVEGFDSRQVNGIMSSAATTPTCITNGNATLSNSNYNAITAYGSTLYGYGGFIVCRTTGGSAQGVITGTAAVPLPAGKSFNDTGLSADGTNCATAYASNNTFTYDYCLGSSLPGNPSVPGAPCGIDGPPLSPNALDDEMKPLFGAPADVNDPDWTWIHQSVATASWTGGMMTLQMANQGSNQLSCLGKPLPAAPYRIVALPYPSTYTGASAAQPVSVGFYESATGKFVTFDLLTGLATQQSHWTNSTTYGSTVGGASTGLVGLPINIEWGRDSSNNLSFWHSQDGIQYAKDYTETVTNFFTTAPDTLVICINPHNSTSGTLIVDYDYVRVKNLAPGATF